MANFEVIESNSALRNFARVYTIDGIEWYDARSMGRSNLWVAVELI